MSQAVLHFRKVKTGSDMANIAAHNSREKIMDESGGLKPRPEYIKPDEPWPPEWCKDFTQISKNDGQMGKQSDSIGRRWARAVQNADLVRKPQKNAARAVEAVLTASAYSFGTSQEWADYLKDCREWVEKKFGPENVLQWNTHFDETTPHLHMILIPICRGEKNKYSSGEFLGGPEGLREMQTDFFNYMYSLQNEFGRQKYPGISRGEMGSTKKHTDQSEWKSELVKKENDLEQREASLKPKEEELRKSGEELNRMEDIVIKIKKGLDTREKELDVRETALDEKENSINTQEKLIQNVLENMKPETNFVKNIFEIAVFKKWQDDFAKRVLKHAFNKLSDFLAQCADDVLHRRDINPGQTQERKQSQTHSR